MKVAIFAHWSKDGSFCEKDSLLLGELLKLFDRVFVCSSNLTEDVLSSNPRIEIIRFRNLGHDFMGYRMGLEKATQKFHGRLDSVFFFNNSIEIVSPEVFSKSVRLLMSMISRVGLAGLTLSEQIHTHIQTFAFGVAGKVELLEAVSNFLENLGVQASKQNLILKGEVELSKLFIEMGLGIDAVFRPSDYPILRFASRRKLLLKSIASEKSFSLNPELNPILDFPTAFVVEKIGIKKRVKIEEPPKQPTFESLAVKRFTWSPKGEFDAADSAVIVHVHYPETIGEIRKVAELFPREFDFFVTTTDDRLASAILESLPSNARNIILEVQENRGRDVSGFIRLLPELIEKQYSAVLKIHGKRSLTGSQGDLWRRELYKELCFSPTHIKKTLETFELEPNLGILGAASYRLSTAEFMGTNRTPLMKLAKTLSIGKPIEAWDFYAGTMFWFRPSALSGLDQLAGLEPIEELGQIDGTLLHAVERTVIELAKSCGYFAWDLHRGEILTESVARAGRILKLHYGNQINERKVSLD